MGLSSNDIVITKIRENISSNSISYYTAIIAVIVILISVLALIGWQINNTFIRSWSRDIGGMNPMTSFCLIAISLSLFSIVLWESRSRRILRIAAIFILSVISLKYLHHFNLINWNIDSSFFTSKIGENTIAHPTSLCLTLLSFWMLTSHREKFKSIYIFPLISSFISFSSFQGHLLGNKLLYSFSMALNTSISLLLISITFLFIKRNSFNDLFFSKLIGGRIARLFFLALLIIVPGIGILVKELILFNQVSLENGISYLITGIIIAGAIVIIYAGNLFNKTDRNRVDLESRNAQHSKLIKSITIPIITFNSEFIITRWNYAAEKLYGYKEEEAQGNYFSELLKIDFLQTSRNKIINKLKETGEWSGEIIITTSDNTELNILATVSIIRGEDFTSNEFIAVNKDITSLKAYETKVSELNEELKLSNTLLQSQVQDLESFTGIASHDLKSPLGNIIVFAELLTEELKDNLNENVNKYIGFIKQRALFMNILIQDLLKLSSLGSRRIQLSEVDLDATFKNVVDSLLEVPSNYEKDIEFHIGKLDRIKADPILVRQIIENLISNSIKYTLPDQKIVISISGKKQEGNYFLVIKDNGIGIKAKYLEELFTPFKRFHSGYEGTGLGLTIVKRIVEKLQGTIKVESTEGKGTTIVLQFLSNQAIPELLHEQAY